VSLWKLMKPGTQAPVGFVRGTQAEAAAAAQQVANQSGQSLSLSRQIAPQVGQVWHGLTGDRCRIVAVSGKRITVLQLDSGQRVTSDLADFLARYRPPRVMPRVNAKDNPSRTKAARAKRTRLLAGTSRKASRAAASGQFTKAGHYSRRSAYRRGRSAARGGSVPAWENGHRANPGGREAGRQLEALLKRARTLWESGRKAEAQKLYERAWEFATPHGNPRRHLKGRNNPRSPRAGAVAMAKLWNDSPDYRPRTTKVKVPPRPRALAKLGDVVSLVYRSSKYAGTPDNPSGKAQLHEHRTSRPHPVLAADPDGHLHLVGGRMRPTADGLVN